MVGLRLIHQGVQRCFEGRHLCLRRQVAVLV